MITPINLLNSSPNIQINQKLNNQNLILYKQTLITDSVSFGQNIKIAKKLHKILMGIKPQKEFERSYLTRNAQWEKILTSGIIDDLTQLRIIKEIENTKSIDKQNNLKGFIKHFGVFACEYLESDKISTFFNDILINLKNPKRLDWQSEFVETSHATFDEAEANPTKAKAIIDNFNNNLIISKDAFFKFMQRAKSVLKIEN